MHTLGWVALVSGAVIVLLVALLQAMRDLMLRDPYAAPEFDGDSDPRRPGESFATGEHAIGECAIGEREPAIGGELRRAGERQARDFVR